MSLLFSMWSAVNKEAFTLAETFTIRWFQVSGNTTAALAMEERLYLITSAGAQPVVHPAVQNKLAGERP